MYLTQIELNQLEMTLKALYEKRSKLENRLARQQRDLCRLQKNSIRPEELDETEWQIKNAMA